MARTSSATPTKTSSTTIVALVRTIPQRVTFSITSLTTKSPSVWPISVTTTSLRSLLRLKSLARPTKILIFSVTRTLKAALFKPAQSVPANKSTSVSRILSHRRPSRSLVKPRTKVEPRIPSSLAYLAQTLLRTRAGSVWAVYRLAQRASSVRTAQITSVATITV